MQRRKALAVTAIAVCSLSLAIALVLHWTRKPTIIDQGWSVLRALQARDADRLAALLTNEELQMLGMTRGQASTVITECVLPQADSISANAIGLSKAGNHVAVEKPKNDPGYMDPPYLGFTRADGSYIVTLDGLLKSAWSQKSRDLARAGEPRSVYRQYLEDQFDTLRRLGKTKVVNWQNREVVDLPEHPVLPQG